MADSAKTPNESPYPRELTAGGVTLTRSPDQLYLEISTDLPLPEIDALLAQYRLRPMQGPPAASPERKGKAESGYRLWLQSADDEDIVPLVTGLRGDERVYAASPVYHRADLLPSVTGFSFTDRLLVRFRPRSAEREIKALIEELGMEVASSRPDPDEGDFCQLQLTPAKAEDVFAAAEKLAHSRPVLYAGPDWIQLHAASSSTPPDDQHFDEQWNLHRIGAQGAWDVSKGSPRVVIAIIDSGCDLTHPDLAAKYVAQADRRDVILGTDTPEDVYGHGTPCAGVAAADTNNAGEGVAGVGWDCTIMPIRIIDGDNRIRTDADIAAAVDWAREHEADVISMSWTWDGPHAASHPALSKAYYAGVVLVASSGNCFPAKKCYNPGEVDFPASHPRVIAVGASDENDKRKQPVTEDRPWHSKFGKELSVTAPGVIPWTTATGGGYGNFYGTSAAAPHVAGLAGLLVSLLRKRALAPPAVQINEVVRNVIEQTAAKVGGYPYTPRAGHPNGTWNDEMGYGRIDAAAALRYADKFPNLERPSSFYALSVQVLLGLTGGGPGVVLPNGGGPVPVDPGWNTLAPPKRDVLLGLAVTQLADGIADPEARQALRQAGKETIERAAQRIGHD